MKAKSISMKNTPQDQSRRRILAVIVLYRLQPWDSASYQSLLLAKSQVSAESLDLAIVLYDNTPGSTLPKDLTPETRYVAAENNRGLAGAYNLSLDLALTENYDWMLTLDQDTHLPLDTFQSLLKILAELDGRPDVAAVVPEIHASGRIVSPNYFGAGVWPRWFQEGFIGIPQQSVYAFNSSSLLRTSALRQIGGYSPWFWLDNSDSMLYRQLHKVGKNVYVAGNWKVNHDFSLLNMQEKVSNERYRMILLTESAFWDMEMNMLAGLERTARLAGRIFKHRLRRDRAELTQLTLWALWSRLFRSKTHRIAKWKRATEERLGGAPEERPKPHRPSISVCLAAYNGEPYIEAQLRSILPQLGRNDEIVIVDDASLDQTVARILTIQERVANDRWAPGILLVRQTSNRGVARTFETAVRSATGDVIFLCNNGDLWAPSRVEKVLQVFDTQPEVDIVSTGLSLMDERGNSLTNRGLMKHRHSTSSFTANLLHDQFPGSAIAFRSSLLSEILPFPKGLRSLHGVWIGTRSALAGKKTAFIDEVLLFCRPHAGNYSQQMSRLRQIGLRIQLLRAHLRFLMPKS
jgi:GT2 family glycosyltransferase